MRGNFCLSALARRTVVILLAWAVLVPFAARGAQSSEEAEAAAFWRRTFEAVGGLSGAERWEKQAAAYEEIMRRFPQTRVALCARANLAGVRINQTLDLRHQGEQEAANELAIDTIGLLRPLLDEQDFGAGARLLTARLNQDLGKLEEAVRYYSSVSLIRFPNAPRQVASAQLALAEIATVRRGEHREAMSSLLELLAGQGAVDDATRAAVEGGLKRFFAASKWWEHASIWYHQVLNGALGPLDDTRRGLYQSYYEQAVERARRASPGDRVAAYCRLWESGHLGEMVDYHLSSLTGEQSGADVFLMQAVRAANTGYVKLETFGLPKTVSQDSHDAEVHVDLKLNREAAPLVSGPKLFKLRHLQGVWRIVAIQPAPAGTEASSHCGRCADESAESPGGCCGRSNTSSSEQPTGCGCSSPSSQ